MANVAYVLICVVAAAFWPVVATMIGGMRLKDRRAWRERARYARERQATALRIWIWDEQTKWHKAHRKDGWDK